MAAVQFFLPYDIAIKPTNIGAPGAKLYVYAYNTTTLLPAYATSALTTQLTNPVVADGAGKFPAIYLNNALSYKIIIKDKLGATLYTKNPYIPGVAPDAAALAPYQAASEAAATAAAASATAAGTSATNAATSATNAATSATSAASSATAAASSATAAASSATSASTDAVTSATSAALASSSYTAIAAAIAPGTLTNAVVHAASRAVLKGLSTASGLPVYFDGSNWELVTHASVSALVTADTAEGIYVRSTYDTAKAWVRQFLGPVKPEWWGVIKGANSGANAATNDAAFTAMWSALSAIAPSTGGLKVLHAVDLGPGAIEISQPIIPTGTVKIIGRGMGMTKTSGSQGDDGTLIIPIGCTAFRFDYSRCQLSDCVIFGDFSATEAEYHGVHFRQCFFGTNIRVQSMRGDAFYCEGTTGLGYIADSSRLTGCEGRNCRNGFYFNGSDANVIQVIGGLAHNNRQWGVWDNGSLGNAFFGVETSGNGAQSYNDGVTIGASYVSYSGNRYGAIAGQESGASTNAPSGTTADNTWWYYIKVGAAASGVPAWVTSMVVRAGGAVFSEDDTARSVFSGCYAETDQAKAQIGQASIVFGGMLGEWMWHNPAANSSGSLIRSTVGKLYLAPAVQIVSGSVTAEFGANQANPSNYCFRYTQTTYGANPYSLAFVNGTNLRFAYNNSSSTPYFEATGANTTDQFGTGAAVANAMWVPKLMVGDTLANGRQIANGTAAPGSGAHARGEVVFNRNASVGSPIGWMCTVAGTPGTWVAMANL